MFVFKLTKLFPSGDLFSYISLANSQLGKGAVPVRQFAVGQHCIGKDYSHTIVAWFISDYDCFFVNGSTPSHFMIEINPLHFNVPYTTGYLSSTLFVPFYHKFSAMSTGRLGDPDFNPTVP